MRPGGHGGAPPPGPEALLRVLREAEATRHANKRILREAADHKRLLAIVEECGEGLHVLNLCTLLHRLARCLSREGAAGLQRAQAMQQTPAWAALLALVKQRARDCNNMELTNCLWALATLEVRGQAEEAVALELLRVSERYLDTFGPRNLALSAWSLAKMGHRDPSWCRAWSVHVQRKIRDFDPRDMTMVLWAFATVHWRDDAFLARFCQEVVAKADDYVGNQDIGNTLWGLATLGYRDEAALAVLDAQCFKRAEHFDNQNLSISLWSYATLGHKNMNLLHFLTQLVTERIKSFGPQGIANTVWACAKFQFQQKCLLMTVAEEVLPRLDDFEPQHLAIVAWAYATLEFPCRPLLSALCQAACRKMHIFSPQHMANMTWAMATLAHKDEEYLLVMARRVLQQVGDFNPQECSNLVWAFALLVFRDDAALEALSQRSRDIMPEFIPQNLGNTAWAYNRLQYRDEELMRCIVHEVSQRLHECHGQEVLDVVEAVLTGGYEGAMEPAHWDTLTAWSGRKYRMAEDFLDGHSGMPLTLRSLSPFDRALAVQDYQDHLKSFDLIGLGYTYTAQLLAHVGVNLPQGPDLEAWRGLAQAVAATARHDGDQEKNAEAQEGLKACRTVCVYRFAVHARERPALAVQRGPVALTSGAPTEAHELGLFAATLRHYRGGDGEFQALQACARACLAELGCDPLGAHPADGSSVAGEMWLHVSEVPCLSCVSAMAQFRKLFPHVALSVSFALGRQPAGARASEEAAQAVVPAGQMPASGLVATNGLGHGGASAKQPGEAAAPDGLGHCPSPRRQASEAVVANGSAHGPASAAPGRQQAPMQRAAGDWEDPAAVAAPWPPSPAQPRTLGGGGAGSQAAAAPRGAASGTPARQSFY